MQLKWLRIIVYMLLAFAALGWLAGSDLPDEAFDLFQSLQRQFHDRLADTMHAIHDTGSPLAILALIAAGFFYGIFHAIGPGHGKVVVTSYLLASERSLRQGLVIVALSSLLQALVAIGVVLTLFWALGLARAQAEQAALILEAVSFALIALVGFNLIVRGIREVRGLRHTHHHHDHAHDDHCGCGHAHMPTPAELRNTHGVWQQAGLILSIGIRPCSGAIILLLFACLIGVVGAGIVATLAMAVGTALTTGALAIAAVRSKRWVLKVTQASERALAMTHAALALGGGMLILLLGLLFCVSDAQLALQPAATVTPPYMRSH